MLKEAKEKEARRDLKIETTNSKHLEEVKGKGDKRTKMERNKNSTGLNLRTDEGRKMKKGLEYKRKSLERKKLRKKRRQLKMALNTERKGS